MKVLLICESFSARLSGGKVARFLHKILSDHGHTVAVVVTGDLDETSQDNEGRTPSITWLATRNRPRRLVSLLSHRDAPALFKDLVASFSPDVVHFASFDHTKSGSLYYHCESQKVRTVLQPWTMHFYCAQGFGYLRDDSCDRCIDIGFLEAFRQGCATTRGVLGQMERSFLHHSALSTGDIFLSSNRDLDAILQDYGVLPDKIMRFPVPFDVAQVRQAQAVVGDYYIFYGQAVAHKGMAFLIDLFSKMPDRKLRIYPMTVVSNDGLPSNIEICNGFGWHNGLTEAITGAKAVLIPSLWRTSTEYSLCEAMAMKKPVIAFDVGAHKELLSDRKNALVVRPNDQAGFVQALDELERDDALYAQLCIDGAARMAEVNDPATLHSQLMRAYRVG